MAKYIIDDSTLERLANSIRDVSGEDRKYTPQEMIDAVATIMDAALYILVDENGKEIPAVFVENETQFDATPNDIRLGKTAVTAEGVVVGTKEIPAYHTTEGVQLITAGKEFAIKIAESDRYNFTKLQAVICPLTQSITTSYAAEKVSMDGHVYEVNSAEVLTSVTTDPNTKTIKMGMTNNTTNTYIIRYFTYKEEY